MVNILDLPKNTQYILAIILYTLAYIYAIEYAPIISKEKGFWPDKINSLHEKCFYSVKDGNFHKIRGENYYIGIMDEAKNKQLKDCMITFWGFSHFFLYTLLGLFCPSLFAETFVAGIIFEGYENLEYDCHDVLDVFLNSFGFMTGRILNEILS